MSVEFLTTLARVHGRDTDAATRRDLAELFANQAATRYLNRQATQRLRAGGQPGPEGSISKLMYSAGSMAVSSCLRIACVAFISDLLHAGWTTTECSL